MASFHRSHKFVLAFHCNYGPCLYHFQRKARYWSIITIFQTPPVFGAPPLGGSLSECCQTFGTEKLEWLVYRVSKKFENMFTHFDTVHIRDKNADTARW